MDSYQHHHQRYMRPPQPPPVPPSSSDPHHHLHHQSRPPLPPQPTWYPNHFQYNPHQPQPPSSHSPSPPPPQQWAAPPPPPNPYSSYHPQPGHQFPPPPRPHLPAPPPHSQVPQSYPQGNQEWTNPNWAHHQGWDYQGAHNNEEDWAARARAWAAQKATTEDQNHQSQYIQGSRLEEQNLYLDQYQQVADSHYQDFQQQPYHGSGYQQFPVSAAPSQQQPIVYQQENASLSSGQSSNDGHIPHTVGGGSSVGAPTSSSVLQQEVPSSYSSVTGKEEASAHMDQPYKSLPLPITSAQGQHHVQQSLSALGGPVPTEQPFSYSNQGADLTVDLSNQPLQFTSNFSHAHDPHMQTSYGSHPDSAGSVRGHGPVPPLPSFNSWVPIATSAVYPPIPPLSLGHQHDPSLAAPSVSGHAAPPFGSFPGTSFQPTIPASGAPYSLGSGTVLHPSMGFPGDTYGINSASERPRKASVPNWLKEEIIKNASVITRSSLEHPKEETQSIEDEGVEKSSGKGDQADSKSIDSSRSTEEEDEDEEDVEAARTIAINQEIKRILTEVLLKVTDELFDEIATKVLHDDGPFDEVDHITVTLNDKISPSPPEVPTPKASAKVLVPMRTKESDNDDMSEKSSSSVPGNVLGLANYASDDDEDDDGEMKSTTISNSKENNVLHQSSITKVSKRLHDENGNSAVDIGKNVEGQLDLETEPIKTSNESRRQITASTGELRDHKYSSVVASGIRDVETTVDGKKISKTSNGSSSKATFGENSIENSQDKDTKTNSYENQHEQKRNYSVIEKDIKETERRSRSDEKGDKSHRKQDEKHLRNQKIDDRNSSKDKADVRGDKTGGKEKEKESVSRKKSSHLDAKEDRKESGRHHRSSAKDVDDRKRVRGRDKEEDRARDKLTSDSSKRKRRRSSSTSSKDPNSNSSDEASDGSKRKLHSRRRNLSPSPVRSRRRQVSRSPHSKHSQRRHSPYSSLETTRVRRSRSKSPVRRRR